MDTIKAPAEVKLYAKKIDSLDQQLESVHHKTTGRIDSLKGAVNNQLDKLKLPKEARGKMSGLNESMNKVNVPSFDADIPDVPGIKSINTGLTDISTSGTLPAANLPSLNADIPTTNLNTPDLKNNLPSELNTDKLNQLNDVAGQAGDIQKQVKEATGSKEALGKTLENKATEQVKGLPDQKIPDIPGMEGGVPKTGDELKQRLADVVKKEAVNHFAGKEQVLMSAMEKMSKYKQKYSSVSSLADIKDDKRHNELKGKPLRERLVPAITLQFQSWQDVMVDINPSAGYRFTTHFTAGLGWNQRVAFNVPKNQFNEEAKVYGIRTFGEYTFNKGFGFRLDVETMNTPAKQKDPAVDVPLSRDWVWGALIGVKQKYPIYKKLKGNAQLMYNIFDKDHRSPYIDRINFRIGLEWMLKKKKPVQEKTHS